MQIFAGKKFENPIKILQAFDNESFLEAFKEIENLRKNHYLLGYIRYEAKEIFLGKEIKSSLPLLYFEVFGEMQRYKDAKMQSRLGLLTQQHKATISYKTYKKAIEQIKEEIACGNTYQVNYTYDYKIETKIDGFDLYNSILPNQTTPYNAYIKNEYEEILSFSPELFFELENNKIKTKPMKGTVKRGENEMEDKKNIEFLKNDIKNRAENVMIVDLLRNDLGKIAKTGTVKVDKLFEVETHNTLHQMTSEVSAELEENTTLYDIFEAIYPCGSITGAPKINTMKIIDELEVGKREIYCGAIGLISPEKTVFSVPIRILQKKTNEDFFLCRVGGAIVWDSTPEDEWEETLTKIKFLETPSRHCEERGTNDAATQENFGLLQQKLRNDIKLVETILVENGELKYKQEHFNRMKKSTNKLGVKFNPAVLEGPPTPTLPLKGGGSYSNYIMRILLDKEGVLETQELPLEPIKTNRVSISKIQTNSKEPLLYHKTTYRPWYDEAMEKIREGLIFDEIFFNENAELTEGARSNVVLEINGELFTPPVKCGLLNGILRQKILSHSVIPKHRLATCSSNCHIRDLTSMRCRIKNDICSNTNFMFRHDVIIKEKKLYLSDLQKAEKVYCINSVRGIVEVNIDLS